MIQVSPLAHSFSGVQGYPWSWKGSRIQLDRHRQRMRLCSVILVLGDLWRRCIGKAVEVDRLFFGAGARLARRQTPRTEDKVQDYAGEHKATTHGIEDIGEGGLLLGLCVVIEGLL